MMQLETPAAVAKEKFNISYEAWCYDVDVPLVGYLATASKKNCWHLASADSICATNNHKIICATNPSQLFALQIKLFEPQIENHGHFVRLFAYWYNENFCFMNFGGDYGYKEGYNYYCKSVR
jgi:hypothetical protein